MPPRILIIKIGAIGDVAMALPMLAALNKSHPGARITWLCGKTVVPLLNLAGNIHEIIVVDEKRLLTGNLIQKLTVLAGIWKKLFARRYDLVLTAHRDTRYRIITLPVLTKQKRCFSRTGRRIFPIPGRYHANEYVRLATGKDDPEIDVIPAYKLKTPIPEHLKELLPDKKRPCAALAPGGAKNIMRDDFLRRWPLNSYASLAEKLLKENINVIITGATSDSWVNDSFKQLPVINLIGRTELIDLLAVYGYCDVVISHDSAPTHLALLAGTKVVGLFGPTNPNEFLPSDSNVKVFWGGKNLACRPCYDGQSYAPCKDNRCLKEIQVDEVFAAARELIFF